MGDTNFGHQRHLELIFLIIAKREMAGNTKYFFQFLNYKQLTNNNNYKKQVHKTKTITIVSVMKLYSIVTKTSKA